MALSERLKQNLKSNTTYYKENKDKYVKPEWGFPSTLDQVEEELSKTDISAEDKKILLDWMEAFEQIKIENDSRAEERREKIKGDMIKLRGEATLQSKSGEVLSVEIILPEQIQSFDDKGNKNWFTKDNARIVLTLPAKEKILDTNGWKLFLTEVTIGTGKIWIQKNDIARFSSLWRNVAPQTKNPDISFKSLETDIERELADFTDTDIEKMSSSLAKSEALLRAYEILNPSMREAARAAVGMLIVSRLNMAGYYVTLVSNKVEVNPIPNTKAIQQKAVQIETFLSRDASTRENIALGLIYQSSEFKNYSQAHIQGEGDKKSVITPNRSYLDYLSDATKGKSREQLSLNDRALLESRSVVENILKDQKKLSGLILGASELDAAKSIFQNNPAGVETAAKRIADSGSSWQPAPQSAPSPVPHTSTPQADVPWTENGFARGLGEWMKAIQKWFWDLSRQPWAMAWLVILTIATMFFKDFKTGLMVLFWWIWASSLMSLGQDVAAKPEVKNAAWTAAAAFSGAASSAAAAVGLPGWPAAAPANAPVNSFDTTKINDIQRKWVTWIQGNKSLLDDIQNYPKKSGKQSQNADINSYLTVIHKDSFQNITLDKIIFTADHDQSIFSDEVKSQLPINGDIPDNVSRYLLKRVLRSYLGISTPLSPSATNKKEWVDTLEEFKAKYPEATWKSKTLKDLINEIHK